MTIANDIRISTGDPVQLLRIACDAIEQLEKIIDNYEKLYGSHVSRRSDDSGEQGSLRFDRGDCGFNMDPA